MKPKPALDIDALVAEAVPPRPNPQVLFTVPGLRVGSHTNSREGWKATWARKKKQKEAVRVAWVYMANVYDVSLPCAVRLVRVGPKKLDSDNLAESFKAVRDTVAYILGVDDGDERIKWEYEQVAIGRRQYAVRVEVY